MKEKSLKDLFKIEWKTLEEIKDDAWRELKEMEKRRKCQKQK
jgi:hypothetical protein